MSATPTTHDDIPTRRAADVEVLDFVYLSDGNMAPVFTVTHPAPGRTMLIVRDRATGVDTYHTMDDDDEVSVLS